MQTVPIVVGIIALIFGVGYLVTNDKEEPTIAIQESNAENMTNNEGIALEETSLVETNNESEQNAEAISKVTKPTSSVAGVYTEYDAEAIKQSDADHILLFFKASWCPSCRALDADIVENADAIPPGVAIYTVDYDTATDLKRKYGVTTQHSIIEISASGEAESIISHPLTLKSVLATI